MIDLVLLLLALGGLVVGATNIGSWRKTLCLLLGIAALGWSLHAIILLHFPTDVAVSEDYFNDLTPLWAGIELGGSASFTLFFFGIGRVGRFVLLSFQTRRAD